MAFYWVELQNKAVLNQYGIDFNGGLVIKSLKYATITCSYF